MLLFNCNKTAVFDPRYRSVPPGIIHSTIASAASTRDAGKNGYKQELADVP